ncbi:hypothetical protein F4703DRAFT_1932567 [Phycomyces blakesleeanus]
MDRMDLDGQTAPESTRGLFDLPEKMLQSDRTDNRRSAHQLHTYPATNETKTIRQRSKSANYSSSLSSHHRSSLHTVNEEGKNCSSSNILSPQSPRIGPRRSSTNHLLDSHQSISPEPSRQPYRLSQELKPQHNNNNTSNSHQKDSLGSIQNSIKRSSVVFNSFPMTQSSQPQYTSPSTSANPNAKNNNRNNSPFNVNGLANQSNNSPPTTYGDRSLVNSHAIPRHANGDRRSVPVEYNKRSSNVCLYEEGEYIAATPNTNTNTRANARAETEAKLTGVSLARVNLQRQHPDGGDDYQANQERQYQNKHQPQAQTQAQTQTQAQAQAQTKPQPHPHPQQQNHYQQQNQQQQEQQEKIIHSRSVYPNPLSPLSPHHPFIHHKETTDLQKHQYQKHYQHPSDQSPKHGRRLSEPNPRNFDQNDRRLISNNNNNSSNRPVSLPWSSYVNTPESKRPLESGEKTKEEEEEDEEKDEGAEVEMEVVGLGLGWGLGSFQSRNKSFKPPHLALDLKNSRPRQGDWRQSTLINNTLSPSPSPRSSCQGPVPALVPVPFTPTHFSFSREENNPQNQRRALFTAHLPYSGVIPLLKSHQLVSGIMRVNKRNRSDAYVFCEEVNTDIYICGSRDRNRALEGDTVAVRLVQVDKVMREKLEKEDAKLARNNGQPVVRKPDEEDEKEIMFAGEDDVDKIKPRFCGVVVAILERLQNQAFSGTLGVMRPSNKRQIKENGEPQHQHQKQQQQGDFQDQRDSGSFQPTPRIVWFKPTDKRVPLIAIPVEQAPADFIENSQSYINRLFLGSIKRWPITSLHPFGLLEAELGSINALSVQFRAILADNNFPYNGFPESLLRCLPPPGWRPSKEDILERLDLRSARCFTIDSTGDKDFGNALSVQKIGDEFEIGFHVSDVSAFVKPHSLLDKEARSRCTGVFVYEDVPLWPQQLLTECTDLLPGKDRFAFSVVWKLDKSGHVLHEWHGKSTIRSRGILNSNQLQHMLDGKGVPDHLSLEEHERPEVVEQEIHVLYNLAQALKKSRTSRGAMLLTLERFHVDFANGEPTKVSMVKKVPADDIMSEFMVLANIGVAQKIAQHFPEQAMLRSQSPPNERKLRELANYVRKLGYSIDPSSTSALQRSVDAIDNPTAKLVITNLVLKATQSSKYFCAGSFEPSRHHHYALDEPVYTHFTSPSRRFADLIVHRQLEAVLAKEPRFHIEPELLQKIAQHCNVKAQAARNAHEQCQHLFLSKFLNASGQTSTPHEALVVGVHDQAFDVVVPGMGLERRIHTINLPLNTYKHSLADGVLHLYWKPKVATTDAIVERAYDEEEEEEERGSGSGSGSVGAGEHYYYNSNHHHHHNDNSNNYQIPDQSVTTNSLSSSSSSSSSSFPHYNQCPTNANRLTESVNQLAIKSGISPTEPVGSNNLCSTTAAASVTGGSGSGSGSAGAGVGVGAGAGSTANPSAGINVAVHRRPRSMSLRAVQGENPQESQQECTIPDECRQVIRPFDYVRVVLIADPLRSPPLVRILAANPFV